MGKEEYCDKKENKYGTYNVHDWTIVYPYESNPLRRFFYADDVNQINQIWDVVPQQTAYGNDENTYDCGVFTLLFILYVSYDLGRTLDGRYEMPFSVRDVEYWRKRMDSE